MACPNASSAARRTAGRQPARRSRWALGLALAAACASLDPAPDRAGIADDLRRRAGAGLPDPPASLETLLDDEVAALLAAPLDEATAVRIALLNNHAVRATLARLGVARADLVQAGLLRNPTFNFDARFVETGGTDLEFGFAQPILELLFLPLRQRIADHEYKAARLRLTDELLQLVFAVRRAYVAAAASERLIGLHRELVEATAESHAVTRTLHEAGRASTQELAVERAAESRARVDLAAAEADAIVAREPLNRLLGLWGPATTWEIAPGALAELAPIAAPEGIETRAIEASIDLAALRQGLDALAQRAGLVSWRGWLPDLAIGWNGIRIPGGTYGYGPRVEGELPVFDAGFARRARAEAELQAGLHDQVQLAVEIRSAARRARDRASRFGERARFLREVHLPARAAALAAAVQLFSAGQLDRLQVVAQRQTLLVDQREYVTTLREAHLAQRDLDQLLSGSRPL